MPRHKTLHKVTLKHVFTNLASVMFLYIALVKLNSLFCDFASLQIVTAGKGTCHTGVEDSAKDTITGESCHFLHTL